MFNFNYNSNYVSSLFSSFGNNNSVSSGIDLSMYSSIRTGSYKKLLNAYYAKNDNKTTNPTEDKKDVTQAQQKVNATSVRDEAVALNEAVDKLNKSSLWEKKEVKAEDGTTSKEYDKNAIYEAVSSYVKSYNALVDGTGNSSNNQVLRTAANMVNFTKANKDMLSKIGISIGTNNKLAIDEKVFKDSDMAVAKSAFTGAGSYGKSVAGDASMIYGSAVSELSKMSTSNMYNSSGAYTYTTGSVYNRFL